MNAPSAEAIARALGGTRTGGQWLAKCPAHEDKNPSLSIRAGGPNGVIFNCLAGCRFQDVRDAIRGMGLLPAFQPGQTPAPPRAAPTGPSAEERRKALTQFRCR